MTLKERLSTCWLFVSAFLSNERSPPSQTIEDHAIYQVQMISELENKFFRGKTFSYSPSEGDAYSIVVAHAGISLVYI